MNYIRLCRHNKWDEDCRIQTTVHGTLHDNQLSKLTATQLREVKLEGQHDKTFDEMYRFVALFCFLHPTKHLGGEYSGSQSLYFINSFRRCFNSLVAVRTDKFFHTKLIQS